MIRLRSERASLPWSLCVFFSCAVRGFVELMESRLLQEYGLSLDKHDLRLHIGSECHPRRHGKHSNLIRKSILCFFNPFCSGLTEINPLDGFLAVFDSTHNVDIRTYRPLAIPPRQGQLDV